jgi:uncharacterized protein YndB with AHSA1/START domain
VTQPDGAVVEQVLRINATPESVWQCWVDPDRMCDWWGVSATLDPTPGGACRVEMAAGPVMSGEFVELVPFERIVFTFGWEGDDPYGVAPGSSRVEVTLVDDDGDTVLTLRHIGLRPTAAEAHSQGWTHFLLKLEEAAGG